MHDVLTGKTCSGCFPSPSPHFLTPHLKVPPCETGLCFPLSSTIPSWLWAVGACKTCLRLVLSLGGAAPAWVYGTEKGFRLSAPGHWAPVRPGTKYPAMHTAVLYHKELPWPDCQQNGLGLPAQLEHRRCVSRVMMVWAEWGVSEVLRPVSHVLYKGSRGHSVKRSYMHRELCMITKVRIWKTVLPFKMCLFVSVF